MKLSASRLGICRHQSIQPDNQPAAASQPLPHDATIPERTTGPEVCALNRQCCGTRDLGIQWWGYPGIPIFSVEAFVFVTVLSGNEDNTCWQNAHWPVALCICVCVMVKMKYESLESVSGKQHRPTLSFCGDFAIKAAIELCCFYCLVPFFPAGVYIYELFCSLLLKDRYLCLLFALSLGLSLVTMQLNEAFIILVASDVWKGALD